MAVYKSLTQFFGAQAERTAGPLSLDDLVDVSALIQTLIGRALTPDESSQLKAAYQSARRTPDGATLQTIIDGLRDSSQDAR
ncbi:Uncharacterised protein [Mycobacteroides abscessus subsp. abscessus]|uniref:hypothetical protein n=1 Tax=Mycobacteroides abscessus TaxID=36809 RepID=UPI00092893CC|nr:hypothetical protein [Mycobacteroides abscessus]SIJ22301.1 Uncharacterised protein [Mycobacteroides abscessus subsp. abscessus]SLH38438.1 Uncharacterised protein [Mycobacteroides abscessus subsp. abscessus]